MPSEKPLDRESFNYLAKTAGLDTSDPHMDELFPYVQSALAANERLADLDTTGFEPDIAFDPAQFYQE
jgi:Asp-tRNA(Asn)/Glu-tRNA(Gln) amidotransferase C subunit